MRLIKRHLRPSLGVLLIAAGCGAALTCTTTSTPVFSDIVTATGSTVVTIDKITRGTQVSPRARPPDGIQVPSGVGLTVTAEDSLSIVMPVNSSDGIWLWGQGAPMELHIAIIQGSEAVQAIDYENIAVPVNAEVVLSLSGGRPVDVRYQSSPASPFDRTAKPTFNVTGAGARDTTAPTVTASLTSIGSTPSISLRADVGASGLNHIYYSFDGSSFDTYDAPIPLASAPGGLAYVFAQSNAGLRSLIQKYVCSAGSGCQLQ